MNLRFLVDTNILSEPARPSPSSAVMERWQQHAPAIATAAPVWHELLYGIESLPPSRKRANLEDYVRTLHSLTVLPYDADAARIHARVRVRLEQDGRPLSWVDGQIAAVASINGLVLVTRNVRHFTGFPGLTVENWFNLEE